jgi:3D (Asp-Asp-Asp) domain-containing protein
VRAERARVAHAEAIARRVWRKSVAALATQLRTLYEYGQPDTLSILFGATSIDDAMTRLEQLQRSARLSRETIAQTRSAQVSLARLRRTLAARAADLEQLLAQAEETTAALEQARARRVAYIASLSRQRVLNGKQIKRLQATSQQIAARSETIATDEGAVPAVPTAPQGPVEAGTITVTATGYSLPGHTATGMPVGWGVVAVDPAVIPLGTRLSVPGYGDGVAADVGSAVRGATIDLWFPTLAQARAWGRRTVTVTLH